MQPDLAWVLQLIKPCLQIGHRGGGGDEVDGSLGAGSIGFCQVALGRVIIGLAGLNDAGVQEAEFPVTVCPEQVGIGILIRPVGEAGAAR